MALHHLALLWAGSSVNEYPLSPLKPAGHSGTSVYPHMNQFHNRDIGPTHPAEYSLRHRLARLATLVLPGGSAGRQAGRPSQSRSRPGVVALFALALATLSGVCAFPAIAGPVLVADIDSGRVLYAKQATDPWYPASVTKLMTAYLTMHALRSGQLKADTPLKVSARAAAEPASKMGFKPGVEVTVDNALKMLMVKSANDMAVVLAEGVGGSVEGFADMMNQAAQELGMWQSHFVNPHGLPDPGNKSSARDLAVLGRTILRQFPEHAHYMEIEAFQLGKRTYKNTNGLVGRYPGVTGMKTGFICSSGFNVVATATRGSRRLMVVVLGAHSGVERTLMAAALLDRGFADSGWGGPGSLDTLPLSTSTMPPDMRPQICGGGARGEEEAENGGPTTSPLLTLFRGGASDWETPVAGRTLPPRSALATIPVFVGRYPGAANDTAVAASRGRVKRGETTSAFAAEEAPTGGVKVLQNVKPPGSTRKERAEARKQKQREAQKTEKPDGKAAKKPATSQKPAAKSAGKDAKKKPANDG